MLTQGYYGLTNGLAERHFKNDLAEHCGKRPDRVKLKTAWKRKVPSNIGKRMEQNVILCNGMSFFHLPRKYYSLQIKQNEIK